MESKKRKLDPQPKDAIGVDTDHATKKECIVFEFGDFFPDGEKSVRRFVVPRAAVTAEQMASLEHANGKTNSDLWHEARAAKKPAMEDDEGDDVDEDGEEEDPDGVLHSLMERWKAYEFVTGRDKWQPGRIVGLYSYDVFEF